MGEQVSIGISKLTGENWTTWKFQVEITLKSKGYFGIVNGDTKRPTTNTDDWDSKDAKAQEIIVSRLDEKVVTHVLACKTSEEMWTKLKSIYEHQSQISVHLLTQKFFSLEYSVGKAADFLSQLEEINGNLKSLGEEISEKMMITKVLMSLPESMKYFISAWESTPTDKQTLTDLTSRLMIEEERCNNYEKSSALTVRGKVMGSNEGIKCFECNQIGHVKRNCPQIKRKCEYCKKTGHLLKDCWFRLRKENSDKKLDENLSDQAFVSESMVLNCSDITVEIGKYNIKADNWWLDSGATEHMCFDIQQFKSLVKMSVKRQVKVGNGTRIDVEAVGVVQLMAWNGKQWIKTDLTNVLYIPSLAVNLFSLSAALDKNFNMVSSRDKCEIVDSHGKTRAIAERLGKLYKMKFKIYKHVCDLSHCNAIMSLNEWHRKLGHINFDQVKSLLKRSEISFQSEEKPFCVDCLAGKQHRLPFPPSDSRAESLCELIHSDICGPIEVESLGGAKYILMFKDDYSGFKFIYLLKNKSQVAENFKKFIAMAENQTGNKIKKIRTDNGLEFVNDLVEKICIEKGIIQQKSCVYTPEQNGRAERENRTVMESVRTLLHSSQLDKKFWAEAANYATYTLNRAGNSPQKNKTPFEVWFNKKCNLELFKEFGEKVSIHVPKQKRQKLDVKNEVGFFLGYGEEVKGYRIYLPHKNRVEIHRDVVFIPEAVYKNKNINETEKVVYLNQDFNIEKDLDNVQTVSVVQRNSENNSSDENDVFEDIDEHTGVSSETYETSISEPEEYLNVDLNTIETKRKRIINKPTWTKDYYLNGELSESDICFFSEIEEPLNLEDAMSGKNSVKWREAMEKELKVLKENNTWCEVPWPENEKVIDSKWVFKIKGGNEFKARLVARGFQQDLEKDLYDIYAPVAKLATFRILLVVASKLGKPVFQMDVRSAFLYGEIDENVYMTLPGNICNNSKVVCKLNKSIYGLKKSPKCWNTKFNNLMIEEGFVRSENDYCLYTKFFKDSRLFVLIYVDDLLILGTNLDEVENLKSILNGSFHMKDLGVVSQYLGIDVKQNIQGNFFELSQENYLKGVLQKFDMQDCKPISTPLEANTEYNFKNFDNDQNLQKLCRQIIGNLMYAALGSRPDICESICLLSRYQDKANNNLLKALKRVLRYVKGSINYVLLLRPDDNTNILNGFVDSDWAGDISDRKSTTGYVFKLLNCAICWVSKKQQCVSISSTESEYIALSVAISEACWLKKILSDFCIFDLNRPIILYEDNQSAIKVANNPENNKRIKHIDVRCHFVKEKIDNGIVEVVYIKSEDQLADIFTKPLSRIKFEKFRSGLGLVAKDVV